MRPVCVTAISAGRFHKKSMSSAFPAPSRIYPGPESVASGPGVRKSGPAGQTEYISFTESCCGNSGYTRWPHRSYRPQAAGNSLRPFCVPRRSARRSTTVAILFQSSHVSSDVNLSGRVAHFFADDRFASPSVVTLKGCTVLCETSRIADSHQIKTTTNLPGLTRAAE